MPQIKIDCLFRIVGMRNIMLVIRPNEHEPDVGNVAAAFQPSDVLEHVVPVVRLPVVRFLEELYLDRASPVAPVLSCQPKPEIDTAASFAAAPQRFLKFDREGLSRAHDMKVGDRANDPAEVKLQGCLALTENASPADLLKEGWDSDVHNGAEAGDRHGDS